MALLLVSQEVSARNWDKDFTDFEAKMSPSNSSVTLKPKTPNSPEGLLLEFQPDGGSYPGVHLSPLDGDTWDFSEYTCIDFTITSLSEKPIYVTARVDNPGDWKAKKWNSGAVRLEKGSTKKIRIFFGYYGRKASYPLDTSKISQILIFTGKASEGQALRIDSIIAGKTPVPFKDNVAPPDGYLLKASSNDVPKEYVARGGASFSGGAQGEPLHIRLEDPKQAVEIMPAGNAQWDLRQGYELELAIRNVGQTPAQPTARAVGGSGKTDLGSMPAPIAPGESGKLVVSFIQKEVRNAAVKKPFFESNKVKYVVIGAEDSAGSQEIEIDSIRLVAPPIQLPEWVGKRPPVEGDWVMTLNEEFDGDVVDASVWDVYASNFWDKVSRFSKDNVRIEDGKAVLVYEKRSGPHNDDPNHKRHNDYTTGFLHSYGKWAQKYGYFEARMKLPKAPGLWPAFWLMPDRGVEAGEQWRRQDIGVNTGGMEFDIMEFLSGWGAYRFTTAFHYDGYGKDHKAKGGGSYTGHDEEGYVTTGLLWLPGLAIIYNNGEEIVRWESDRISTVESIIIFTFVAGGWDNEPMDDKQLPEEFVIDYVRVWQRADLASEVDGFKP
ncbi:glycoside hydrolase family 16 protein [Cerasicoccus arenae]|uniref:GH16 domain-containing protein n=1 Tax=Cerasicoccus arenae TaxID=424488 RepID=A0A8J3DIQ9_9BACT|nr:glycoside hydrolase family 16 protein [Cerasicoccus arenae]MBK1857636.1 glycoside hydrolase family 16 protein [Cerasicoccus arenae]GHC05421.1 hypothetical protein GCM10007047_22900 [Cerasicoccus arenae]